jgi:alkylation response protein AidB-like acyl-CoA dehydrogenase
MAYEVTPSRLIDLGRDALNQHWPEWAGEHFSDPEHDHEECRHAEWPGQENVSREVVRALKDAGYLRPTPLDDKGRLPRPFLLVRDEDETGISGTGVVADQRGLS